MMLRFVAAIVQYNISFLHISCHNVTSTLILWMICRQPPPHPPSLSISISSFVPCSKALTIALTQNTTLNIGWVKLNGLSHIGCGSNRSDLHWVQVEDAWLVLRMGWIRVRLLSIGTIDQPDPIFTQPDRLLPLVISIWEGLDFECIGFWESAIDGADDMVTGITITSFLLVASVSGLAVSAFLPRWWLFAICDSWTSWWGICFSPGLCCPTWYNQIKFTNHFHWGLCHLFR